MLSAFEESSAACISEMLTRVSNCLYMEAVAMAEMFIFHVEVLFASIDVLEKHFTAANAKGMWFRPFSFSKQSCSLHVVRLIRHVSCSGG